jgi:hypothetical protein
MTQTIGTGANAHETQITITNQITKTIYVTGSASVPVASSVSPVSPEQTPAVPVNGEGSTDANDSTTLVTSDVTSTVAKTLTITEGGPSATPTGSNGSPSNGTPSDVPANPEGSAPAGGECASVAPVTVTVTAQETVTVVSGLEHPSQSVD